MSCTRGALLASALLFLASPAPADPGPLLTVAERSNYQATARHAEVVSFCEELAKQAPNVVRLAELGTSGEGRKLPLLILADPPITTPAEAAKSGKLVALIIGNIHAGEVDGKEGLLMLARDLATAKERPLLKDLVLVIAPNFNADGNEKVARTNRPEQNGPADGVGTRANGQGLDLNRDFVKLESPEVQALVRAFNKWDPALFIDCHTTNGSYHRYTITYEGPRHPACDPRLAGLVRDEILPDAGKRLKDRDGFHSFFYGIQSRDKQTWETVPPTPRYGIHYVGLRNRLSVLVESYSYAPYKDRCVASRDFVRGLLEAAADRKDAIKKALAEARDAAEKAAKDLKDAERIVLRGQPAPQGRPVQLLGYEEEEKDGKRVPTDRPREYEVVYLGAYTPTLSVRRPWGYLLPPSYGPAVAVLQRHGLAVEELREDVDLDVETYHLDQVRKSPNPFQKHTTVRLEATAKAGTRRIPAGTVLVRTAQPLGTLAALLLEPQSEDGLATWNFFDSGLTEGQDFPVQRLPAAAEVLTGRVRPLPEDRATGKPIRFGPNYSVFGLPNFSGTPTRPTWDDDGEHFFQEKGGRRVKVHAATGKVVPHEDKPRVSNRAKLIDALAAIPGVSKARATNLADGLLYDDKEVGAYALDDGDLYYVRRDGTAAIRLTKSGGRKELIRFSPDGKHLAFVKEGNLYAVDVTTPGEKALTTDGGPNVQNGIADWVYYEEVFDHVRQAYWWSPDGKYLAFLRFDETNVPRPPLTNHTLTRQKTDNTPYPKAGDPNPVVKFGIVPAAGGPVAFADLAANDPATAIVQRGGWWPDSSKAYCYLSDRAQKWLDVCTVPPEGGKPTRLFRETTGTWVDEPGAIRFLKDGTFLFPSQRTGWKHWYHYDKDGKLLNAVTAGEWEADAVKLLDEDGGWLYVNGTKDSTVGMNLYRVKLDGTGFTRLTAGPGHHDTTIGPKAKYFIDTVSSHAGPAQVRLYATDGTPVRTLDTNPVYAVEEYRWGKAELVRIPTPDGATLEGSVVLPPTYDPAKKYPVWFRTYGGPHAPTVRDTWGGGGVSDQALASLGFILFRCDPRSASHHGARSTWAAYKQLGVQELKDLDTAITWLKKTYPGVDGNRIGFTGGSYGGFLVAFAMTHSKLFAAGVAAAPVTDWHNYDSIYTERYMDTPEANPEGYKATSVVKAAKNLHGRLLLVHGMLDDNVHVQNTLQLVGELQRADKDFEVMIYPTARHGGFGAHYNRLQMEFMIRTLKPQE